MNKGTSIIKYVFGLLILAVIVVGIVFIAKGNKVDQDASIYKVTDVSASAHTVPPISVGCHPGIGPNGQPIPATPSITVTSPNGGEVYTAGQTITVKWNMCNVIPSMQAMKITLEQSGVQITANTYLGGFPNTGSAVITLPTVATWGNMVYGNNFKILVEHAANSAVHDESNNLFTINGPTQNVVLNVSKDPTDGTADVTVAGSSSSNTNGVLLAKIDVSAQGDSIVLKKFPVSLIVGSGIPNTAAVVNTLRLYDANGNQLDSQTVPSGANQATITFQNLNENIANGTTKVLLVKGDFNAVGGTNFPAGSYAEVDATSSNVSAIQAYDSASNAVTGPSHLTGSSVGHKVYMYVNGIMVASTGATSASVSTNGGSGHTVGTFTIPFSVTAFGQTAYIPASVAAMTGGMQGNHGPHVLYAVDQGGTMYTPGVIGNVSGVLTYTGGGSLTPDANGNYVIPIGQTKNFALIVVASPTNLGAGQYRVSLANVSWSSVSATAYTNNAATGFTDYTLGLNTNAFRTSYVALQ